MPILAKETDCWPHDLLDQPLADLNGGRCWWTLYCKARHEKSIARYLEGQQIAFYLPLIPKVTHRRGRRWESYVPLFTGYVFLFGTFDDRLLSLKSNRISTVLQVGDQVRLHSDLQQVRRVVESGQPLAPESHLMPGRLVRIHSGPLAGLEGRIIHRAGISRLVIAVNFLKQGVSVEVDDYFLELID
jgi:transcription antitermination factor NusG